MISEAPPNPKALVHIWAFAPLWLHVYILCLPHLFCKNTLTGFEHEPGGREDVASGGCSWLAFQQPAPQPLLPSFLPFSGWLRVQVPD